ncbi:hypothetical protein BDF20DRAFT_834059 [Mycotypha africana]|uniref:uncharacterized protein n=1 Tax=Mycotypha africana TaxID=64632 RepID=UPI00230192FA|nr:uncharacterized protein BDF20DRAFT_834059 [Mycotypha africana]KAI8984561.1 hypothetical protein BDF20DRAFT_834059 [Mycotypha africana]
MFCYNFFIRKNALFTLEYRMHTQTKLSISAIIDASCEKAFHMQSIMDFLVVRPIDNCFHENTKHVHSFCTSIPCFPDIGRITRHTRQTVRIILWLCPHKSPDTQCFQQGPGPKSTIHFTIALEQHNPRRRILTLLVDLLRDSMHLDTSVYKIRQNNVWSLRELISFRKESYSVKLTQDGDHLM